MPGENLIAQAASGWTGPEAVAFGAGAVLLVGLALVLWRHLADCKAESRSVREELVEVKLELARLAYLLKPKETR